MSAFFEMIAGLSPWSWVAVGVVLGVIEMLTMSFFLIGPALASLALAVIVGLFPGMAGEILMLLWAVLAVVLTLACRPFLARYGGSDGAGSNINERSAQLVGRRAVVLEWRNGEGSVEVDGIRWRAAWQDAQAAQSGAPVEVIAADGMTLTVRNQGA